MRERYNVFIQRHDIAWELAMGLIAIVSVALGFVIDDAGDAIRPILEYLEVALSVIFVLEFASRLLAANDRSDYVRHHLIDAVAMIPPLRVFRILRLIRLFRLFRAFSGIYRAGMQFDRLARHRGFAWILVAWFAVLATCSAFVFVAEHGLNKLIDTPFDALWWGVSTITAVAYGDTYPVTPEGRAGGMVLMLLGIVLFSSLTAAFTSFFVSSDPKPGNPSKDGVVERLQMLVALRQDGLITDDEFSIAKAVAIAGE